MDNYGYVSHYVLSKTDSYPNPKVLDYGCGAGKIVENLLSENINAFGCDIYYEGGDYSGRVSKDLLESRIFRMANGVIPFQDDEFDIVVSNQVLEHVENLDAVLQEIHRVLKPGGTFMAMFPDKGVWREGHCGIPFLHWFPKGSRFRVKYATILRKFGLGYFHQGKSATQWAEDFCIWLDNWTHYREIGEIRRDFNKYFFKINNLESDWMVTRWPRRANIVPKPLRILIAKKLGQLTFDARSRKIHNVDS